MMEIDVMDEAKPVFSHIVKRYERDLADPAKSMFEETIKVIDELHKNFPGQGVLAAGNAPPLAEHWYTRLAAGITKWATHPDTTLNFDRLSQVCRRKQDFMYIFHASGYRNMGHLNWLLANPEPDGRVTGDIRVDSKKVIVLLALLSLDDLTDDLLSLTFKLDKRVLIQLVLGWLNQRTILTEQGEKNRGLLLTSGHLIEDQDILDQDIGRIVNASMYASYASHPKKHEIKRAFHRLLTNRMSNAGINTRASENKKTKRPVVMVVHERFQQGHAMFRSYAPLIRGLTDRFDVSAVADDQHIDESSHDLFEKIYGLKNRETHSIPQIAELILKQKPDIVYYPSLGMSHWTVMLANLRLARIQVVSQGHPATSMSKELDYAFVNPLDGDPTKIYSEIVLMGERDVSFELRHDLPEDLPQIPEPSQREVRIAVNSKVMKLSYRLFEVCKRIQAAATVPIRFQFFPGEVGWHYDGICAAIKSQLPGAEVIEYKDYVDVLTDLSKCDMALSAFPFGNTNSTVDTCLLGLPTVANFGPETPAQTDKMVLKAAGFPDWLVCADDEAYFQTAMKLIEDPELRRSIVNGIDRDTVRKRLEATKTGNTQPELSDMLWHVYQYHEKILESGNRIIKYADL